VDNLLPVALRSELEIPRGAGEDDEVGFPVVVDVGNFDGITR
jgi:hypothetical protein